MPPGASRASNGCGTMPGCGRPPRAACWRAKGCRTTCSCWWSRAACGFAPPAPAGLADPGSGTLFGEMAFLEGRGRLPVATVAPGPGCEVREVEEDRLAAAMAADPLLARDVYRLLATKLAGQLRQRNTIEHLWPGVSADPPNQALLLFASLRGARHRPACGRCPLGRPLLSRHGDRALPLEPQQADESGTGRWGTPGGGGTRGCRGAAPGARGTGFRPAPCRLRARRARPDRPGSSR
jgi:hypothetical protein